MAKRFGFAGGGSGPSSSSTTRSSGPSLTTALRKAATVVDTVSGMKTAAKNTASSGGGGWGLAATILGLAGAAATTLIPKALDYSTKKAQLRSENMRAVSESLRQPLKPLKPPVAGAFVGNADICNETTCERVKFKTINGGKLAAERQGGTVYQNCGQDESGKRFCQTANGKMREQ